MTNKSFWVRYKGAEVPCIQSHEPALNALRIIPGKWLEVEVKFKDQFSAEKGWEISDKEPSSKKPKALEGHKIGGNENA